MRIEKKKKYSSNQFVSRRSGHVETFKLMFKSLQGSTYPLSFINTEKNLDILVGGNPRGWAVRARVQYNF